MARPNLITQYMTAPLPCASEQRRLPYRPSMEEARSLYNAINRYVFENQLTRPDIYLKTNCQKYWGVCNWEGKRQKSASWGKPGTWCTIELMDKWFCPQWFCNTLAHEMVHQYQWDLEDDFNVNDHSGAHGPSFFAWKERFSYYGLHLKTSHGMKRWLKHQDFRKC
jgi:hypothetical protein